MVFYNRRFNAYDARDVAQELAELVARHRLTEIALLDSNFLVDVRRAVAIAEGILETGARFRWTFQASTDLLCRMSDGWADSNPDRPSSGHIHHETRGSLPPGLALPPAVGDLFSWIPQVRGKSHGFAQRLGAGHGCFDGAAKDGLPGKVFIGGGNPAPFHSPPGSSPDQGRRKSRLSGWRWFPDVEESRE